MESNSINTFNGLLAHIVDLYEKDEIYEIIKKNRNLVNLNINDIKKIENEDLSGITILKFLEMNGTIVRNKLDTLAILFPCCTEEIIKYSEMDDENSEYIEIEVGEISAKNGRLLYYSASDNKVYEMDKNDEAIKLGILLPVDYNRAPITYQGKKYIVADFEPLKNDNKEYKKCVLENKLYQKINNKYIKVGKLEKQKDGEMKPKFDKKKRNMEVPIAQRLRKNNIPNNPFILKETRKNWNEVNNIMKTIFNSINELPSTQLKKTIVEKDSEEDFSVSDCTICKSKKSRYGSNKCGHNLYCEDCIKEKRVQEIKECPICKMDVKKIIKFHF